MATHLLFAILTIFVTHHAASLIQTVAHRFFGHRSGGGYLQKLHTYEHHGVYPANRLISEHYLDEARSADIYYAAPALLLAYSTYTILPIELFVLHGLALCLSILAHLYLHVQYHLTRSWLARYRWFQSKRRLHLVHHRDMTRNYAVIEFFWDRVLGTLDDTPLSV